MKVPIPIGLGTCFLLVACATNPPPRSPVYQAVYEWTPPEAAAPAEAELTIALVAPEWPGVDDWWQPIATEFARNMSLDFEELLTARGFTVRGPFKAHDDMVYGEKEQSNLMITPRLDVTASVGEIEYTKETRINLLGPNEDVYKISRGTVTLGGRVTLVVAEPFTEEKLWTPSIELDKQTLTFVGELEYSQPPTQAFGEPQFRSALNRTLEGMYDIIMRECWERVLPVELAVLDAQAIEIRKKAGYVVPGPIGEKWR